MWDFTINGLGVVCFLQQRNLLQRPTPSRHVSAPVAPPRTLLHHPLHPHPQTQATQTLAERQRVSILQGCVRDPGCFASHWVDWTKVELLMMEPQGGSGKTGARLIRLHECQTNRKREMGLFLPSAHSSSPGHRKRKDGWMNGKEETRSCRCEAEWGDASSPVNKGEDERMRWRDKGARARIFVSGDNFPSYRAPCLDAV